MKPIYRLMIAAGTLLSATTAFAGNEGGHGGGAIVCSGLDEAPRSAQLLDLWEKRHAGDGSTVTSNDLPESVQLEIALAKFSHIAPAGVEAMRKVLATLKTENVGEDEQLMPPSDTGLRNLQKAKDCPLQSLQGVADFDDSTDVLTLDPEILAAMCHMQPE